MAHYAYKRVRNLIPDDFCLDFEKQWLEGTGREFDGSSDYDGDLWHLTAAYIEHLHNEIKNR